MRGKPGVEAIRQLAKRKLGRLRPWAWGPDSMKLFEPLFARVSGETQTSDDRFNEGIAALYSKAWSAAFLRNILRTQPGAVAGRSWLCEERDVGVTVETLDDALAVIEDIRERGHLRIVVKQAFGLAGQSAIRLWEPELLEKQRRWINDSLQGDGKLVIEPWLEREVDFSVQLEMTGNGLKLHGYTGLINDPRGQFQGNWAEPNHSRRVPARVLALLRNAADTSRSLDRCYAGIFSCLEIELERVRYLGPLGIDSFVYRATNGERRLKPVVEINPRYTMGRLTLELMNHVRPGRRGLFRLLTRAMIREQDFTDFASYARRLSEQFPLRLEGSPVPRIGEGAVCLNDPTQARVCLATFQVGPTVNGIQMGVI
jgi:hypothetical protein